MIFYIRDKQTDRNLFEVEIYGKKNEYARFCAHDEKRH